MLNPKITLVKSTAKTAKSKPHIETRSAFPVVSMAKARNGKYGKITIDLNAEETHRTRKLHSRMTRTADGNNHIKSAHHTMSAASSYRSAMDSYRKGRILNAIIELTSTAGQKHTSVHVNQRLGAMKEEVLQIRAQSQKLQGLVRDNPDDFRLHFDLAKLLAMIGEIQDAKRHFDIVANNENGNLAKIAAKMSKRLSQP